MNGCPIPRVPMPRGNLPNFSMTLPPRCAWMDGRLARARGLRPRNGGRRSSLRAQKRSRSGTGPSPEEDTFSWSAAKGRRLSKIRMGQYCYMARTGQSSIKPRSGALRQKREVFHASRKALRRAYSCSRIPRRGPRMRRSGMLWHRRGTGSAFLLDIRGPGRHRLRLRQWVLARS